MSHTKEPWNYGEDNDGWYLERKVGNDGQHGYALSEENARRIVACINACAGLPTEELEAYKGYQLSDGLKLIAMTRQRNELLAALERIGRWLEARGLGGLMPQEKELISSVKGGAA